MVSFRLLAWLLVAGLLLPAHAALGDQSEDGSRRKGILAALNDIDARVQLRALEALERMRAVDLLPVIVPFLNSDDPDLRRAACRAFEAMSVAGSKYSGEILPRIHDTNPRVAVAAASALAAMSLFKPADISSIGKLLKDSDENVRVDAAKILGALGSAAVPEVEALADRLDDASPAVSSEAGRALGRIAKGSPPATELIVAQLQHGNWRVRGAAMMALAELGPVGKTYAGKVRPLLHDQMLGVAAATTLAAIGALEPEDIAPIVARLRSTDLSTKIAAAETLGSLGLPARQHFNQLAKDLEDVDASKRISAVQVAGWLRTPPSDLADKAAILLRDTDALVREAAVQALGNWTSASERYVGAMVELLKDQDLAVRDAAARSLGRIRNLRPEHISALGRLLDEKEDRLRSAAYQALGDLGAAAGIESDRIAKGLQAADSFERLLAAQTLGLIGKEARRHARAVAQQIRGREWDEATASFQALMSMGILERPEVLVLLEAAYGDELRESELRFAAYASASDDATLLVALPSLGLPTGITQPAFTRDEAFALVNALKEVWEESSSNPRLREDTARRAAEVAGRVRWTGDPDEIRLIQAWVDSLESVGSPLAAAMREILRTLKSTSTGQPTFPWARLGIGSGLLLPLIGIVLFRRRSIPPQQYQIIRVICALAAGCIGFFITGDITVAMSGDIPSVGKYSIDAVGAMALFAIVYLIWVSPTPPVRRSRGPKPSTTSGSSESASSPEGAAKKDSNKEEASNDRTIEARLPSSLPEAQQLEDSITGPVSELLQGELDALDGEYPLWEYNSRRVAYLESGVGTYADAPLPLREVFRTKYLKVLETIEEHDKACGRLGDAFSDIANKLQQDGNLQITLHPLAHPLGLQPDIPFVVSLLINQTATLGSMNSHHTLWERHAAAILAYPMRHQTECWNAFQETKKEFKAAVMRAISTVNELRQQFLDIGVRLKRKPRPDNDVYRLSEEDSTPF